MKPLTCCFGGFPSAAGASEHASPVTTPSLRSGSGPQQQPADRPTQNLHKAGAAPGASSAPPRKPQPSSAARQHDAFRALSLLQDLQHTTPLGLQAPLASTVALLCKRLPVPWACLTVLSSTGLTFQHVAAAFLPLPPPAPASRSTASTASTTLSPSTPATDPQHSASRAALLESKAVEVGLHLPQPLPRSLTSIELVVQSGKATSYDAGQAGAAPSDWQALVRQHRLSSLIAVPLAAAGDGRRLVGVLSLGSRQVVHWPSVWWADSLPAICSWASWALQRVRAPALCDVLEGMSRAGSLQELAHELVLGLPGALCDTATSPVECRLALACSNMAMCSMYAPTHSPLPGSSPQPPPPKTLPTLADLQLEGYLDTPTKDAAPGTPPPPPYGRLPHPLSAPDAPSGPPRTPHPLSSPTSSPLLAHWTIPTLDTIVLSALHSAEPLIIRDALQTLASAQAGCASDIFLPHRPLPSPCTLIAIPLTHRCVPLGCLYLLAPWDLTSALPRKVLPALAALLSRTIFSPLVSTLLPPTSHSPFLSSFPHPLLPHGSSPGSPTATPTPTHTTTTTTTTTAGPLFYSLHTAEHGSWASSSRSAASSPVAASSSSSCLPSRMHPLFATGVPGPHWGGQALPEEVDLLRELHRGSLAAEYCGICRCREVVVKVVRWPVGADAARFKELQRRAAALQRLVHHEHESLGVVRAVFQSVYEVQDTARLPTTPQVFLTSSEQPRAPRCCAMVVDPVSSATLTLQQALAAGQLTLPADSLLQAPDGPMPPALRCCALILLQVAEALQHLHALDVPHGALLSRHVLLHWPPGEAGSSQGSHHSVMPEAPVSPSSTGPRTLHLQPALVPAQGGQAALVPAQGGEATVVPGQAGQATVVPGQAGQATLVSDQVPGGQGLPRVQLKGVAFEEELGSKHSLARRLLSKGGCGATRHLAPELMQGGHMTSAADIYAFGILMWEALTGHNAFQMFVDAPIKVFVALVTDGARPALPPGVPQWFASLAAACWHANPQSRPSASQVVAALRIALGLQEASEAAADPA